MLEFDSEEYCKSLGPAQAERFGERKSIELLGHIPSLAEEMHQKVKGFLGVFRMFRGPRRNLPESNQF
ncbi:hypothetical protein HUU39_04785 [candidate division KSB1 bacterium]|nr:hypothetical protein [bacterium]NUM64582.1 hypothetical protein [candidate division KSB1 bacterium]